jgi:hypothetical protein
MPRYRNARIAIVTLGTGVCLVFVVGSVIQRGMAPLAGATDSDKDAYSFGIVASVLALMAAVLAYRYPRTSAVIFGVSAAIGQLSIHQGNSSFQVFVGVLVVLCLAACYGVIERGKDVLALQGQEQERRCDGAQ